MIRSFARSGCTWSLQRLFGRKNTNLEFGFPGVIFFKIPHLPNRGWFFSLEIFRRNNRHSCDHRPQEGRRHRPSKPPVRETAISAGALQKGHPRTGIRCAREEAGGKEAPTSQPSREKIPENPSPSFELGKDPIILLKTPERRLRTEFSLKRRGWPGRIGASSGWSFCDSRWCPRGDLNTRPKV